ncbi:MAG: SLC13 family permease, partial [Rhodospirillales bacterium]
MTVDQIILFSILGLVLVLLMWGRLRYDLIAFGALMAALLSGVVPLDRAFSGFGHPATVVVAFVLIISRGLSNSGVVEYIAAKMISATRPLFVHIGIMSTISAALSAVMNNVAALALLMPVDMQAAAKAKRSPALTLMPLSFASILGGLVTLIGTPPNIIIATFRETALGESYHMFDFAPVGLICAVVGVLYITLIGWRLIPAARAEHDIGRELFELEDYIAELKVADDGKAVGQKLSDIREVAEESDAQIIGIRRNGYRISPASLYLEILAGDVIVVKAGPEAIEKFTGALKLDYVVDPEARAALDSAADTDSDTDSDSDTGALTGDNLEMREVVVPNGALIEGRSARSLNLLARYGVNLLGVSRQGERFHERVRDLDIQAGDVLLLLGRDEALSGAVHFLGGLPLAERGLQVLQRQKAGLAIGIFAAAILAASFGLVYLSVALGCVVALYALFRIIPVREIYGSVEWSVIILLGSLIPIGEALETSGGTGLIAGGLLALSYGYPAVVVLTLLMIITMTLSDVINNTATAVIAAPIAVDLAGRLNVSPDPFLMAVAVAASCAFLTPIGHKNNTLIMGPGGYRFGD